MAPLHSRRRWAAAVLGAITLSAAGFCVFVAAGPAAAGDPPRHGARLRLCDPTGCYVAWRVVDSDHDGASDADELAAGTDPYDPESRPLLTPIVALAEKRSLPSFEAGLGTFVAFPADIVAARQKFSVDPLGAFPLCGRKDTLTRLGIDLGQLASYGIDPSRDGFSVGLGGVGSTDGPPGTRVAGIDARLIGWSDPAHDFGEDHGGVKNVDSVNGGTVITYQDGATKTTSGITVENRSFWTSVWTNSDGSDGNTVNGFRESKVEGGVKVTSETQNTVTPEGRSVNDSTEVVREYADGSSASLFTSVEKVYDENGKQIGTVTTTIVGAISSDGNYAYMATTIEVCDNGGTCSEVYSDYEDTDTADDDEEYRDPDAAAASLVTFEAVDMVLRTRGAAITVMSGWTAPGMENDPKDPRDPSVVALVDSDQQSTYLLVEPLRVTTAQPEIRPDLPNPLEAAPPPRQGGVCQSLCG